MKIILTASKSSLSLWSSKLLRQFRDLPIEKLSELEAIISNLKNAQ